MNFFAYISLIVFSLYSFNSHAFINIESLRQLPGEGFVGSSSLQAAGQSGNTQKFTSSASSLGIFRTDISEYLLLGDYKYGTSNDLRDSHAGSAHARYTYLHREALAYEFYVQSEFDEFKDLNSRNLIGMNFRRRLIFTDDHRLFGGLGSFYEFEDFQGPRDKEGFRGNIYLTYNHKLTETTSGSAILYYQPSLKTFTETRLRFQGGLDFKISSKINIDLDLSAVYDNALPPGVKELDTTYFSGLSITY